MTLASFALLLVSLLPTVGSTIGLNLREGDRGAIACELRLFLFCGAFVFAAAFALATVLPFFCCAIIDNRLLYCITADGSVIVFLFCVTRGILKSLSVGIGRSEEL